MITRWVLGAALAAALALSACTPNNRNLEAAKPEAVGLSGPRLARLTDTLKADVDQGKIPGAVVLVARQGKLAYHEAIGFRDREAKAPMPKDAIFRIYSMTKPITSIAALMLIEEGKMSLGDPVSRWLPELAKR
ncbi:MAG: beta-lactamase family protein, partial [Alphaproteobacteria bacterium]|nr:beta-lactamase family protein [Alphaproteobacteria bacterium]